MPRTPSASAPSGRTVETGLYDFADGPYDELSSQRAAQGGGMRRLRILVLMHKDLVPPEPLNGHDPLRAEWKTEYDVVTTLRKLGHEVKPLGVKSDLGV